MKAYIKKEKFEEFKNKYLYYGFKLAVNPSKGWVKEIDPTRLWVVVMKRTGEVKLLTPMGGSPFMEAHKDKYQELIDNDMVEFVKGRFD